MPILKSRRNVFILFFPVLVSLSFPVFGGESMNAASLLLSPGDHPAAETLFVPSPEEFPAVEPDPAWLARTGAKKGLSGKALTGEELLAAPDIAVLDRGFSAPWNRILAEQQEPSVHVRAQDLAGLSASKPLLIVPSGSLAGTAGSAFFKAGLAEYVRRGGTVFCLAQRSGADFSGLPVPEGQRLDAAGWSEADGPLFRTSTIPNNHPLLAELGRPAPAVETDGHLRSWPAGSQVLLMRPDGFPTLIVYPFGKGWVVVSTLFPDFSSLLGAIERDEKILIRNLLAWIRDPRRTPSSLQTATSDAGTAAPQRPPLQRRIEAAPAPPDIRSAAERKDGVLRLWIEAGAHRPNTSETLLVRVQGREKSVPPSEGGISLSFDIPLAGDERRVSYAFSSRSGRALARGTVSVPAREEKTVLDRSFYLPDQSASIAFKGMGKSEVTLAGMGFLDSKIISNEGSLEVAAPRDLPSGSYPMQWTSESMQGEKSQGEFRIDLAGYRVAVLDAELELKKADTSFQAQAHLRIKATEKVNAGMTILLKGPDGTTRAVSAPVLSLVKGIQTVPIPFTFTPDAAGIWELTYLLSAALPEGAGIPPGPVTLASGSMLFDVGETAVLAVVPDRVFYYEPAGPVAMTAIIAGTGKSVLEVHLDGKHHSRERRELDGTYSYGFSLPALKAGRHHIRVTAAKDAFTAAREQVLTYGLGLPDLAVNMRAGDPGQNAGKPVMPFFIEISNRGKSTAAPHRAGLYKEDGQRKGKLIAGVDVPRLEPGAAHTATIEWPLHEQAGAHRIAAVVDVQSAISESNKDNNRSVADLTVPDMLLLANSPPVSFSTEEPLSVPLSLFNLAGRASKDLTLTASLLDSSGRSVSTETLLVPEIRPGRGKTVSPLFKAASAPAAGTYLFSAALTGGPGPASVIVPVEIRPTLLLSGLLEGTPETAMLCRPFTIRYRIRNEGNVFPSSGTCRIEILLPKTEKTLFSKTVPLVMGDATVTVDTLDMPESRAILRLTASTVNEQYKLSREFRLVERPLTISGPVAAARTFAPFPRVLIWAGREGRIVEQAVSDTIINQAFQEENLYYKIVDSEEHFSSAAMTGMFNIYVLFEPDELPSNAAWLRERLERGQGVVIIGAGESARALAEKFGISLEEVTGKKGSSVLAFTRDGGIGLSGTLPVTGKILSPRKRGAVTIAVDEISGLPAALVDPSHKGRLVVMPLSFSSSAFKSGTTALYSLALRTTALSTAPEEDGAGGPVAGGISLSARAGEVRTRIRETLPAGSTVLWTNAGGKAGTDSILYEVTAGPEPAKLLYLYQPPKTGGNPPAAEVSYDCNGIFVSQGKVE
jgi:hypothetical protein